MRFLDMGIRSSGKRKCPMALLKGTRSCGRSWSIYSSPFVNCVALLIYYFHEIYKRNIHNEKKF